MKKLFYPLLLGIVMFVAPSVASAALYVSGNIGIASPSNVVVSELLDGNGVNQHRTVETPLDPGVTLLGAVGYDFGNYRIEGEVGYQKTTSSGLSKKSYSGPSGINYDEYYLTGDGSVLSFLVNAYKDFHVNRIKPYLTGGFGVARFSIENIGGSISDAKEGVVSARSANALVYQIGCGVEIPISNTMSFDARFRHFATKAFNISFLKAQHAIEDNVNADNIHFSSNSFLVGLNVKI